MEEITNQHTFKSYIFFLSGQLFSLLGSLVVQFVIIFWITIETGSAMILALANFFYIFPLMILTPIAGVYADRLNKKYLIVIVDSLQAYFTLILTIFFLFNVTNIWVIFITIGLRSVFQAFHAPAVSAIVPIMVPKEKLSRINGITYLFTGFIQLIGPGLAATLLAFFSTKYILWIDLITFLIALVPLLIITIPVIQTSVDQAKKKSFFKDFKQGIKEIKKIPGFLIMMPVVMLINFLLQPLFVLLPLYITAIHGGGAIEIAIIEMIIQGGMISGAIISSVKKRWKNQVFIIFIGALIANIGYAMYGLSPVGFYLLMWIGGFSLGFISPIVNTIFMTIMQSSVPKEKYGRAIAIISTVSMVIMPLGVILSWPLSELLGIAGLFLYCALFGAFITLGAYFFTNIRHVNYDQDLSISTPQSIDQN
jgi:DHA3 family macrolide efflux protein-like MFS transporter